MLGFIILLLLGGLVIGAIARLLVPGRNPMGIGGTILLGIGGTVVGGLIGRAIFHRPAGGFILAVAASVVLLLIFQGGRGRTR